MSTLKLTLKEPWFTLTLEGHKLEEFREPSEWIESRLYHGKTPFQRHYDKIRYTNGYGATRPWVEVEFKGSEIIERNETIVYHNGVILVLSGVYHVIKHGKVLESGNLPTLKNQKQ